MNFQCSEIQQYTSTSFMRYRPIIITIISLSLTDSPPFGRLASTITQQYNHLVVAVVVVVVGWVMMVEVESSTRVYPTNNNNYDSNNQNITQPTHQQLPQQQSIIYNNQQQQPHRAKHHGRHCIIQSVFSEAFLVWVDHSSSQPINNNVVPSHH